MLYVPLPVMSDVTSISYHAFVETAPTVASSALSLAGAVFQVTVLSLQVVRHAAELPAIACRVGAVDAELGVAHGSAPIRRP